MRTVDEILSAAALLPPDELDKLRAALKRLDRLAETIELKTSDEMSFYLHRLNDSEYREALRRSLAIDEDYGFYVRSHLWRRPGRELNFAEVYLTLTHLAGESSHYLDDWKMAFSFPFALDVVNRNKTFAYLLEIRNIRDSLYFTLRKLVDPEDARLKDGRIHSPFADEFPFEEMRYFRSYLYGYLLGRWEQLRPELLQAFVCRVPSEQIIFGYCDGKVFEEQFKSTDDYEAAFQRIQKQVEQERAADKADNCLVLDAPVQDNPERERYEARLRLQRDQSSLLHDAHDKGISKGERNVLLRQGTKKFGPPDAATRAALESINDPTQLEQLSEHLLDVASWQELLATRGTGQ